MVETVFLISSLLAVLSVGGITLTLLGIASNKLQV